MAVDSNLKVCYLQEILVCGPCSADYMGSPCLHQASGLGPIAMGGQQQQGRRQATGGRGDCTLANWITKMPTPPAPACTSTREPALTVPCSKPCRQVQPLVDSLSILRLAQDLCCSGSACTADCCSLPTGRSSLMHQSYRLSSCCLLKGGPGEPVCVSAWTAAGSGRLTCHAVSATRGMPPASVRGTFLGACATCASGMLTTSCRHSRQAWGAVQGRAQRQGPAQKLTGIPQSIHRCLGPCCHAAREAQGATC